TEAGIEGGVEGPIGLEAGDAIAGGAVHMSEVAADEDLTAGEGQSLLDRGVYGDVKIGVECAVEMEADEVESFAGRGVLHMTGDEELILVRLNGIGGPNEVRGEVGAGAGLGIETSQGEVVTGGQVA